MTKSIIENNNIMGAIEIYTDGSCVPNPGKGSWAYRIIKDNTVIHMDSGACRITTNNRMELYAVIKALEYCYPHYSTAPVTVYTDSELITKWWQYGKGKKK